MCVRVHKRQIVVVHLSIQDQESKKMRGSKLRDKSSPKMIKTTRWQAIPKRHGKQQELIGDLASLPLSAATPIKRNTDTVL